MWIVKVAYSHQTATVSKYLRESFEPFAVIDTEYKDENKKTKKTQKMYFKRWEGGAEERLDSLPVFPEFKVENLLVQPNTVDFPDIKLDTTGLDKINERFIDALNEWASEFINTLQVIMRPPAIVSGTLVVDPKKLAEQLTEDEEIDQVHNDDTEPDDEDEEETDLGDNPAQQLTQLLAERREVPEGDFLSPESFGVKVERGDAKGDTFRVVDESPVKPTKHSLAQELMIDKIRETHDTNITIGPKAEDGTLTVYAEDKIYTIKEDGMYNEQINPGARQQA